MSRFYTKHKKQKATGCPSHCVRRNVAIWHRLCWMEEKDQPGGKHYHQSLNAQGSPAVHLKFPSLRERKVPESHLLLSFLSHILSPSLFDFSFRREGALTHTAPRMAAETMHEMKGGSIFRAHAPLATATTIHCKHIIKTKQKLYTCN